MILFLEDNLHKITKLIQQYDEEIKHQDIFITAYPTSAEALLRQGKQFEIVFLDYELPPGAGNGLDFLRDHLRPENCTNLVITTQNPLVAREMARLCQKRGLTFQVG